LIFGGDTHDLVWIASDSYRTKDETFIQINYVSPGDYWTVRTKDGTTHRFGFNSDSKATGLTFGPNIEVPVTFRYFVDEVSTTSGVAVRYSYFKQSSSYNAKPYDQAVYPDTITYAYRNGSLIGPAREVHFIRGNRTDWTDVSAYEHTSYHELYRLDAIEVKVGGSLVRKYNLAYDYSIDRLPGQSWGGGSAGDLTLKGVTMLGSDGTTPLPAMTFTYSDAVLATVNNGIGSTKTFTYEGINSITKNFKEIWIGDPEDGHAACRYSHMSYSPEQWEVCFGFTPFGILQTRAQANTRPFYRPYYENPDSGWCVSGELTTTLNGNECKVDLFGHLYTSQVYDSYTFGSSAYRVGEMGQEEL
jgi:hypothetical protein